MTRLLSIFFAAAVGSIGALAAARVFRWLRPDPMVGYFHRKPQW